MGVGDNLKKAREKFGWTIKELSEKAQVGQSTISEIETGKAKNPKGTTLTKLAKALGVTSDYLLGTETTETNEKPKKFSPEIETIAAHLDDKNITPKKLKMIQDYIDLLFDDEE